MRDGGCVVWVFMGMLCVIGIAATLIMKGGAL